MSRATGLRPLAIASVLLVATAQVASTPVAVAQTTSVGVTSARPITSVVDDPNAWFAALSPSGTMLAYYVESGRGRDRVASICVFTFETAGKACHPLPEAFVPNPYQLVWSPDESSIAFSENPIELRNESDIWLYDVASGTVTDLTDDGVTGGWSAEGSQPPALDYLPFWSTTDGSVLFWRVTPHGDLTFDLGIYSVPPAGGTAQLVVDVGALAPGLLPTFQQERFFLDGPSSLSPDGSTVAALLTGYDPTGIARTGLWFLDLSSAEAEQVVGPDVFANALPSWETFPTVPRGVSWSTDPTGVVTLSTVDDLHAPFTVFHYVDAQTKTATPVVDFSGLDSYEALYELAPDSQLPWRAFSPWTATLSPRGDKVLMVNDLAGTVGLLAAQLPPSGALPQVAASAESTLSTTASRSSRSSDGKVTVYGFLLSIEEQ